MHRDTALESRLASGRTVVEPAGSAVQPFSNRTTAAIKLGPPHARRVALGRRHSDAPLLTGWMWVQRVRSRGTRAGTSGVAADGRQAFEAPPHCAADSPARVFDGRRANRDRVDWPVVFMPASALVGMAPQQLEAILAHELAHIRRHDYLVNLLQTLVETLLFYHPAVWWLSRRIRGRARELLR